MNTSRPRSSSRLLLVLAAVAATLFGLIAPANAAAPYCGITWGSLAKTAPSSTGGNVTDVRAGQHACFDRLVINVTGARGAAYSVKYVPKVTADPSDLPVPLRGRAFLSIVVFAPSQDADYVPTYQPANKREVVKTTGFATFRQVAWAGSFEDTTSLGLGVRARLPFRVFTLAGPGSGGRVVIDVAHHW